MKLKILHFGFGAGQQLFLKQIYRRHTININNVVPKVGYISEIFTTKIDFDVLTMNFC